MNNSHNEFHPGTFADSVEHFLFEGKFGWLKKLGWLLSLVVCICFSFFSKEASAKESYKKTDSLDRFYLVQEYIGNKAINTSKPHRLSCLGKVCTLFSEDKKVKNFFSDKKCLEKKEGEEGDKVSEFSCSDSNTIKRVMILSKGEYLRFLLTPKEEARGKLNT